MDHTEIQNIIERQKHYFESGITLDVNSRLAAKRILGQTPQRGTIMCGP